MVSTEILSRTVSVSASRDNNRQLRHRIKTHRRSTQPKKRKRCHATIRHQNADAMVLASALMRGIPPGRPSFWILSGGWTSSESYSSDFYWTIFGINLTSNFPTKGHPWKCRSCAYIFQVYPSHRAAFYGNSLTLHENVVYLGQV
jgi:hypothetical protein